MRYLSIMLILLCLHVQSQSYTVIHTIGKIYDSESGRYLTKGLKISEDASLKFETKGARAAVLSSSRGRFIIQENSDYSSQSDALYALSTVISPVRGRLSTRAGSINNALDFRKLFDEGPVAWVGNTYSVRVSQTSYPMSESQFFYAQYQYQNETINKKLNSDEEKLIIDTNSFYSIDGVEVDPSLVKDVKLYFYKAEDQSSTFITNMNLVIVSSEALKSLLDQFSDGKETAVLELINSMYGKCSEEHLKAAISEF
ncbi:hypothetical protein [Ekhidna sp.]|uniref:hypothetical protein n=1 Tax=Ekhidna sp. TaxID=2608089 RepID=UPI003298BC5D